jgi:DNA-directed RNA polymerase subunit E'/Rpb7
MSKTTRTSKKIQIIDNNDEETKITQSHPIYEKIDLNSIKGGSVEKKQVIKDDIDAINEINVKNTPVIANNEELDNLNKIDFQSSLIHSPYIETSLRCPIMLNPTQMDNKLQLHLKSNLNNYTKGRCYLNYGYIIKINKIEEISDGRIEEEDSSCSAKFIVKFSCRLCLPAKNREIICKIDRMNKALISGVNGPIKAIITPDKINKDKFFTDTDRNIRIKSSSQILEPEMYIKVLILSSTFSHYDTNIIAISYLQDIATAPEVKLFEREQYLNQN